MCMHTPNPIHMHMQGWPRDGEGLHDCCQWCCGEIMGDYSRQQKSGQVVSLLCDGCDTAW